MLKMSSSLGIESLGIYLSLGFCHWTLYNTMLPRKSLGQHFLKSTAVVNAMVAAAKTSPDDTVLEAGPGKGILTGALLHKAQRVIAVEKDDRLIDFLKQKFSRDIALKKLLLVHDDILLFDSSDYKLKARSYKLVANIPYYITGLLFKEFFSVEAQPSCMALLVQKEVAQRIVAKDGKESILSISVKAYGEPRYVKTVKARDFSPPPKVDSAILAIENISRSFFDGIDEDDFFTLVKTGFGSKRKFVVSNLKKLLPDSAAICAASGIHPKARAQDLSRKDWKNILITANDF